MKSRLTAEWDILVRNKDGRIVKHLTKDADLVLLNWKKLASFFSLPCYNTEWESLISEAGESVSSAINDWHYSFWRYPGMKIVVGSNTTPPSENDYKLGSKWGDSGTVNHTITKLSDNEWQVELSASFSPSVQRTLGELGVLTQQGTATFRWFMWCRDVLPEPIIIPAGGSVTISYTLKSKSGGS
jgi:hypothetical protein